MLKEQKMTKTQAISSRIAALIANGYSIPQAIDAVMGAGTYARIASDVWDALNAQQEG